MRRNNRRFCTVSLPRDNITEDDKTAMHLHLAIVVPALTSPPASACLRHSPRRPPSWDDEESSVARILCLQGAAAERQSCRAATSNERQIMCLRVSSLRRSAALPLSLERSDRAARQDLRRPPSPRGEWTTTPHWPSSSSLAQERRSSSFFLPSDVGRRTRRAYKFKKLLNVYIYFFTYP